MKHVVTGGSGYVGGAIARYLAEKGESVTVCDIWQDNTLPASIQFVHGDICNASQTKALCSNADVIHHCAAVLPTSNNAEECSRVNVEGTRTLANCARNANVQTFIHMSSTAVFGGNFRERSNDAINPSDIPQPIEAYGTSKLEAENAAKECLNDSNTALITIRPQPILGAGRLGILGILFSWITQGQNIYLIGGGKRPFQFLHINDLLSAYSTLLTQQKVGTWALGTDTYGSLRQTLTDFLNLQQCQSSIVTIPTKPAIFGIHILHYLKLVSVQPFHYLTSHRACHIDMKSTMQELGWQPQYSNLDMFIESFEYFQAHRNKHANEQSHRKALPQGILKILQWVPKKKKKISTA